MNARTALAVVAALVLGIVLGMSFGGGGDAPRSRVERVLEGEASEPAAVDAAHAPLTELAGAGDADASARSAAQVTSSGVAPAAIERARAAAPDVVAPSASGVITGFVRDESGAPLAGVEIRLIANSASRVDRIDASRLGAGFAPPQTIDAALEVAAKRWSERQSQEARAVTDDSGAFSVPALGGEHGSYVQAALAGFIVEPLGEAYELSPGAQVDFVARKLAALLLDVVDVDGRPLDEALIERKKSEDGSFIEWRRGVPLRLPPEHTTLRAHRGVVPSLEYDKVDSLAASEWATIDLAMGSEHTLQLALALRTRLSGVVVDARGSVLEDHRRIVATPRIGDAAAIREALPQSFVHTYARKGRFVMLDIAPGEWVVAAEMAGDSFVGLTDVTIAPGALETQLVVEDVSLDGVLVVRVLSRSGVPVHDYQLDALLPQGDSKSLWNPRRDAKGAALITLAELARDAADPWSALEGLVIVASTSDGHSGRVAVETRATEAVIELEPPGRLVVAVDGLVGTPWETVVEIDLDGLLDYDPAYPERGTRSSSRSWGVKPNAGVWTYPEVPNGWYDVALQRTTHGRGGYGEFLIARALVEVRSSEARVEFTMPSITEVRVVAPAFAEGVPLVLSRVSDAADARRVRSTWTSATIDAAGIATFPEVVAGRYRLSCQDADGVLELEVPCGDVTFDLPRWNAMRVVVTDANGGLHGAGLRDGDLIVAFDGTSTFSPRAFGTRLRDKSDAPLVVTVRRGSERFDVDLAPLVARADWQRNLGGQFLNARDQ